MKKNKIFFGEEKCQQLFNSFSENDLFGFDFRPFRKSLFQNSKNALFFLAARWHKPQY